MNVCLYDQCIIGITLVILSSREHNFSFIDGRNEQRKFDTRDTLYGIAHEFHMTIELFGQFLGRSLRWPDYPSCDICSRFYVGKDLGQRCTNSVKIRPWV